MVWEYKMIASPESLVDGASQLVEDAFFGVIGGVLGDEGPLVQVCADLGDDAVDVTTFGGR